MNNIYCAKCKNILDVSNFYVKNCYNFDCFDLNCNCGFLYSFYRNKNKEFLYLQKISFIINEEEIEVWWNGDITSNIALLENLNYFINCEIYTQEYAEKYNFYSLQDNINDVVAQIIKLTDNIVFI